MVLGKFIMFSILNHLILVFPEHNNSRVFFYVIQDEIMQISKAKHLKTCENFGKKMNENSRDLGRHYKGRNFVLKFQVILYGRR